MQLHEFKSLLQAHPEKAFRLSLPGGKPVPGSFHITEVGRIQKTFLDCGGKLHESETCQLQVWVGEDEDHRIETQKMAGILEKARSFLGSDSLPLEFEYEDQAISQYIVEGHEVSEEAVVFQLGSKHTACLAMEICCPSSGDEFDEEEAGEGSCCSGSKCC